MKSFIGLIICLFLIAYGKAQIPSTDIFLIDVVQKGNGFILKNIKNITSRSGYDNQPYFSEDGNYLYFSSDRDGPQTDVYRYDISKRKTERITSTPESEFSPTPIPGSDALSVVRVDADSSQRIYKIQPDGSNPVLLYNGKDTIGYHSWLDPARLLVFTLPEPFAIRVIVLAEQQAFTIAQDADRCMQRVPGENAVSFTIRPDSASRQIKIFDGTLNKIDTIINLPEGSEFYAWMNSSTIVSGSKGKLLVFDLNSKESGWQGFADISNTAAADFYRIAFDPSGKRMALVVKN